MKPANEAGNTEGRIFICVLKKKKDIENVTMGVYLANLAKLTPIELAHIAGFLDADGCINAQIVKNEENRILHQIRFTVTFYQKSKRKWLLVWFREKFGVGSDIRKRKLAMCDYTITGIEHVKPLLKAIYPYIKGKRRQTSLSLFLMDRLPSILPKRNEQINQQTADSFIWLCHIVDHFGFLNDSRGRTNTSALVKKRLQEKYPFLSL